MIKLIIFDLDGTLIDAYGAIEKSLNFTLRTLGYKKATLNQVKVNVGLGDKNFVNRFVEKQDVAKALALYRQDHHESLLKYSTVKPTVRRTIVSLHKKGIKLAVASNRPTKFSHILLRHLKLDHYFDMIACADKKHELKPEPFLLLKVIKKLKVAKEEVLYVGDMCFDVEAGNNARVKAVAVLGGSSTRSELAKCEPHKIISRIAELERIMK